tara:strand:- start:482 stop:1015 length:534 start_codon:yes stop_codon:yes gene_type:complete
MINDNDFFLKQMKGVTPIKKNNKIKEQKPKIKTIKKKQTTTSTIITEKAENTKNKSPELNLEKINIKKAIKKGSFVIDKKIDFHGNSLLEAEKIFSKTIIDCFNKQHRCLLFVTGKGLFKKEHSIKPPKLFHGVIRSSFAEWARLPKLSRYILAFESAAVQHGGEGAFYVYLRKKKF